MAIRTETRLKGVDFRSFMKAFLVLRGAEAVERMLADLPSEVSEALRYGLDGGKDGDDEITFEIRWV